MGLPYLPPSKVSSFSLVVLLRDGCGVRNTKGRGGRCLPVPTGLVRKKIRRVLERESYENSLGVNREEGLPPVRNCPRFPLGSLLFSVLLVSVVLSSLPPSPSSC